jgi:coenzyme PQQ biosynthesis protein PqqD
MPSEGYPRRRTVPWRAIDTEAVVVDVKSGLLYPLNAVAAMIWNLCDGSRTVDDIVGALVDAFDAEPARIAHDVREFLAALTAADLITAEPTPCPTDPEPSREDH